MLLNKPKIAVAVVFVLRTMMFTTAKLESSMDGRVIVFRVDEKPQETPKARQPEVTVETIAKAWRARQDRLHLVKLKWTERTTVSKVRWMRGQINPPGWAPTKAGRYPPYAFRVRFAT
jgi:hypothetical protein